MGEGLLTQRRRPYRATRHPHRPPPQNCADVTTCDVASITLYRCKSNSKPKLETTLSSA